MDRVGVGERIAQEGQVYIHRLHDRAITIVGFEVRCWIGVLRKGRT